MSDEPDPFLVAAEVRETELHKCNLCNQVATLSATRRKQLRDAIFGKTKVNGKPIGARVILRVLSDWGLETSATSINLHRSGGTSENPLSEKCRSRVASAWGADSVE